MKTRFVAFGGLGWSRAMAEIGRLVNEAFALGHAVEIVLATSDKPTDLMRKKFHAMCGDLAKQVREYRGAEMNLDRWKAVCMGAAIDQEWLPAWNSNGVVPFRKSSENLNRRQYCDCIEVAYAIGAHFNVAWSDPKHRKPEPQRNAEAA